MCHREISENTDIYRLWKCRIILEITEYVSLRFWRAKWARVIWESPALDDSKSHGHGWDSQKLGWEGQRILARTIRQRKSVLQRERRIREKKNRELKSVCPSNQGQWGFKEAGGVNCAKCCRGQINQVWKPWCKCRQSEGLSHPFNSDLGLLLENPADFHSCWWKISSFPHSYNVVLSILKRMPFFFFKVHAQIQNYLGSRVLMYVLAGTYCMCWTLLGCSSFLQILSINQPLSSLPPLQTVEAPAWPTVVDLCNLNHLYFLSGLPVTPSLPSS